VWAAARRLGLYGLGDAELEVLIARYRGGSATADRVAATAARYVVGLKALDGFELLAQHYEHEQGSPHARASLHQAGPEILPPATTLARPLRDRELRTPFEKALAG
jgi:hypothetical protein